MTEETDRCLIQESRTAQICCKKGPPTNYSPRLRLFSLIEHPLCFAFAPGQGAVVDDFNLRGSEKGLLEGILHYSP